MARVVYFELGADDPRRAMDFYAKVFGWTFRKFGDQDYWQAMTGDQKGPGIDGAIQPRTPNQQPVTNTIGVDDIDGAIRRIEENGGKVVVPKTDIPNVGTLAYFADTEGNVHGVIQPLPGMQI
jgi:predicted enzyme related to lactoylglutathione lyase